ncbi:MAG: hypothetical protein AAB401_21715 [Acidobacteriota bacterium]
MSQTLSIELINGTLALDEATLRAAQIMRKARVILQERAILILPEAESDAERCADPVNSTFGLIQLPLALAREIAESKELEYEL